MKKYKIIVGSKVLKDSFIVNKESIFFHPDLRFSKPLRTICTYGGIWETKKPLYKKISGYEMICRKIPPTLNIRKYYDKKLSAMGWEKKIAMNADGPNGSSWLYQKNNCYYIILRLEILTKSNKKGKEALEEQESVNLIIFSNLGKKFFK